MPIAADPLLSRGYMGDGVTDFATITAWVREAGYTGDIEVEIFNQEIWEADGDTVIERVKARYAELVLPYA
jgi:sugar phosphate isomerase/epimerase